LDAKAEAASKFEGNSVRGKARGDSRRCVTKMQNRQSFGAFLKVRRSCARQIHCSLRARVYLETTAAQCCGGLQEMVFFQTHEE
jgi:hypothetical protein